MPWHEISISVQNILEVFLRHRKAGSVLSHNSFVLSGNKNNKPVK